MGKQIKKLVAIKEEEIYLDELFNKSRMKTRMRDNYIIDDLLGQGTFGEVRRCVWMNDPKSKRGSRQKEYRAVKILSKNYMEEKEMRSLKNEIGCLSLLSHPNIMKFHHFYEDMKRYMIITELCTGGDLFELISASRLSQGETAVILKQVLSAITHLHERNIVHRDLKPENVLLQNKKDTSMVKIIDFGTAAII